jgi:transcriptional regulator with XRE-family HTH domain
MAQRSTDIVVRFGRTVQRLRREAKISQEAFADKCGLDRTYVSGIERGLRNLTLRNIEAIAKGLGLTLPELFKHV